MPKSINRALSRAPNEANGIPCGRGAGGRPGQVGYGQPGGGPCGVSPVGQAGGAPGDP
ncbi:hypothetical protein Vse01_56610 [Micromonospora sediminimaris]|uniref:Uncharacterized protein n=1 Tax=Micromonospora sediminimaris TaxID=547162 RepID=A0A9W5XN70_9ACTN|nr:hypothetical protein Vse01_56610 [Micromonospora sediminimaris]